jgi:nucleotide-binding universal stress UspA family protein
MVKNILVAIDGSVHSRHAARFALSLAGQTGAKVTLLSVLPQPELLPLGVVSGYAVLTSPMPDAEVQKLKAGLDEISAESGAIECSSVVEIGPVADTIVDYAGRNSVDLIVLGARGLSPARRFLLGSVSDRVIQHAHCPVTVWR